MVKKTELSRKIVRTLLAMSVLYAGGVPAESSMAFAGTITTPQNFDALSLMARWDSFAIVTKGDVRIKAAEGKYALLVGTAESGSGRHIIVNPDGDKAVQITGDIGLQDSSSNRVILNLASADLYWAGKYGHIDGVRAGFDLRLSNQAVWYAGQDSFKNYTKGEYDESRSKLTSDGGIIDLYHSLPER